MADSKISDLTALTTPANDDVFAVVDTDAGQTKKITFANLNAATSASVAADDISTGDAAVTIATSTGDITIDAPADIILDADSGAWRFKDNGGSIIELSVGSGNSPTFYVANSDADLVFKGNDGGSAITALTLDMSSGGQLLASPLGVSVPSYSFSGDSNTGMTRPTSDTLQFVTGGSERVRIDSSGRVGIGASSPTTALTIYNSSNPQITFGYDADQSHQLAWDSSTVAIKVDPNNDGSNSSFAVDVDGSERLRIDSNGKLIIADSASHSDDFLQIETPASGGGHGIQIRRNDSNNDQQIGRILFGNNTDTDIATIASKTDGANDSGALLFSTQTASGSSTERLRIDSSGNVGIGTTSPSSKLDMRGTGAVSLNVGSTDGTTARLTLDATNGDASGGDFPLLLSDGTSLSIEANNSGSNAFMTFSTNASEKVRIDSSGKVGIGETSPLGNLHVKSADSGATAEASKDELVVEGSANSGISILSGASSQGGIAFGDSGDNDIGRFTYSHSDNSLRVHTNGSERVRIDSSGNVGIGTTSPSSTLHVVGDLKIDDITIDGSTISDGGTLTIDVASNLEFDAGGGLFSFKDDGSEVYRITNSSGDISLKSLTSDKDISIQGNDGGSVVSAVTFDMSDAGTATFNHDIKLSDSGALRLGDDGDAEIYHDGSQTVVREASSGNLVLAGNNVKITGGSMLENHVLCNNNGSVDIYHDNSVKLQTTSSGIDVTGLVEFDSLSGTGSVAITDIADEDDMTSNSATKLSTQQSIKAYADTKAGKGFAVAMAIAL